MKNITPKIHLFLMVPVFLFFSCSKEGPTGEKGDPGTANVIYSEWLQVSFSGSNNNYSGSIRAPELTQDILDKGEVAVFMRTYSNYLKDYVYFKLDMESVQISRLALGQIYLHESKTPASNERFRYVLIPGGTLAKNSGLGAFSGDYQALCTFYKIPE